MFSHLRHLLTVGVMVLGMVTRVSGARACDTPVRCCTCKYVTTYVCVTVYETRQEAYTKVVTLYDECGRAYQVSRTCYREVRVPVKKVVPVTKKVLVCE